MKKIILTLVVFILGTTNVLAIGAVDFSYTKNIICNRQYDCFPVYYMSQSGLDLYFLNYSKNFNIRFSQYEEVSLEDTPFPPQVFDYVSSSKFIKNNTYYREVMIQKLWELYYNDKIIISNPQKPEVRELSDNFSKMISKMVNEPMAFQKTYSINSSETLILDEDYINLYEVVDDNPNLIIKENDNNIEITGSTGEYKVKLKRKNSGDNPPKIFTDGVNYIIKEGDFANKEYAFTLLIDMKQVNLTLENKKGKVVDEQINIYHNSSFYKTVKTDNQGQINILLPVGQIDIKNKLNTNLKSLDLIEDVSLIINDEPSSEKPQEEENGIVSNNEKDSVILQDNNSALNVKPEKNNQLITVEENKDDIVVILPDTLCI